jgi:TetR/AcrR family transcriptional regulator, fatty acid metabolism regulator protein
MERESSSKNRLKKKTPPPGKVKIMEALKSLLREKDFGAITTAGIAGTAGVTEALIYKYFKDKRDLLHQVLSEYLEGYLVQSRIDIKGIKGAKNKIRKLVWSHSNIYATNRVFAKILLIEVRNHPDYYKSDTYDLVKQYSDILLGIIEEGLQHNEIRTDISPGFIRQSILGCIEQACFTSIIFDREISPDQITNDICELVFKGIEKK